MQIHDRLVLAATQTPCKVIFEQAAYRFSPCGEAFIDLTEVSDMAMDGNGSTFVFTGRTSFVRLRDCQDIQIMNFTFDVLILKQANRIVR